jgi:thymidylate synthase (FAD)
MIIAEPKIIVEPIDYEAIMVKLERAIRTCYKSEGNITKNSAEKLIRKVRDLGHHSTLEHHSATVKFITDRGVTHELVRHRLASYSQESTRYCNYGKDGEITVIRPCFWIVEYLNNGRLKMKNTALIWEDTMRVIEEVYLKMIRKGASPQEARTVLPNSLKTEIVTSANLREWRHIFTMRCSAKAHPQIQQIMIPLLIHFQNILPALFEDIPFNEEFPPRHYADLSESAFLELPPDDE